ncbi:ceramide kinase-like [Convolutriloba macropyga]|uniref:ceramide kinase-like n=1 Tax=Convolutriloba macropyga TaxID=536237 RepID=UPI003F51B49D
MENKGYDGEEERSSPSHITTVISEDDIATCFYKSFTFYVTFDATSNQMTFKPTTPGGVSFSATTNLTFTKSLSDLIAFKSDGDSRLNCYFVFRAEKFAWRFVNLQIVFQQKSRLLAEWTEHINNYLSNCFRPKNLLFIINPKAGNNTAKKYFSTDIEPVLKMVDVKYEVHLTRCQGDATEVARTTKTSPNLDGVISVSGDGTFNEVVRGMLDQEDSSTINPNSTAVATIPCGTANTLAYSMHGTDDKETALLHILLGDVKKMDVMAVRSTENKVLGVALTLVGFGFFADAIRDGEGYKKWLPGTFAYSAAFMKYIIKMKKYRCSVQVAKTESPPYEKVMCKHNCTNCDSEPKVPEAKFVEMDEPKIFGIQFHNHTSKCEMSPRGASIYGCFSNGLMDMHIMRDVTRGEVTEMLKEVGKAESDKNDYDFVETMRVNKARLSDFGGESENDRSAFILDGEIIEQEPAEVACHQRVLTYFGRGVELDFGTGPEPLMDKLIQKEGSTCGSCSIQ